MLPLLHKHRAWSTNMRSRHVGGPKYETFLVCLHAPLLLNVDFYTCHGLLADRHACLHQHYGKSLAYGHAQLKDFCNVYILPRPMLSLCTVPPVWLFYVLRWLLVNLCPYLLTEGDVHLESFLRVYSVTAFIIYMGSKQLFLINPPTDSELGKIFVTCTVWHAQ